MSELRLEWPNTLQRRGLELRHLKVGVGMAHVGLSEFSSRCDGLDPAVAEAPMVVAAGHGHPRRGRLGPSQAPAQQGQGTVVTRVDLLLVHDRRQMISDPKRKPTARDLEPRE